MSLRPRKLLPSAIASTSVALGIGALSFGPAAATAPPLIFHPGVGIVLNSASAAAGTNASVQSNNWAGYDEGLLDTATLAQSISAKWTIPTATQKVVGQAESSATWIGVGGGCVNMTSGCSVTDPTLVQAGTEQDVSSSGQASYSAWWEILPVPSITSSITVHPGDTVSVSIGQTLPEVWSIKLTDTTDGQGFTETVPYPSTMDTAEWIEEAPVVIGASSTSPISAGEAALPNLGTVSFSGAALNGKNAALSPSYEIQMVSSSGAVLATPSAPNSTGDGFNVCTYITSCAAP